MQVEVMVEDDKTCSVVYNNGFHSFNVIQEGPFKIGGLTPEQAVIAKRVIENVFKDGQQAHSFLVFETLRNLPFA